jgi:hypothetical protein
MQHSKAKVNSEMCASDLALGSKVDLYFQGVDILREAGHLAKGWPLVRCYTGTSSSITLT